MRSALGNFDQIFGTSLEEQLYGATEGEGTASEVLSSPSPSPLPEESVADASSDIDNTARREKRRAWKACRFLLRDICHWVMVPSSSQRSCQLVAPGHRNTWPLIRRQFLSALRRVSISSSVRGSPPVDWRLLTYSFSWMEKGMGICPRCTAHFKQIWRDGHCGPWRWRQTSSIWMSATSSGVVSRVGAGGAADGTEANGLDAVGHHIVVQLGLLESRGAAPSQ